MFYSGVTMRRAVAFAVVSATWLLPALGAEPMTDTVKTGQEILTANCSRCHAIGMTGSSPHPQAPPFREVVTRIEPANLEEALAEGLVTGHPDMPEFVFEPREIDAIVAYLNSISPGPAPRPIPFHPPP
jgi:mono/diheme cytochrome c family protein